MTRSIPKSIISFGCIQLLAQPSLVQCTRERANKLSANLALRKVFNTEGCLQRDKKFGLTGLYRLKFYILYYPFDTARLKNKW